MKNQKFRNLQIWQKAMEFVTSIYVVSASFPAEERFGLTSQIRRAAVSIALNIAEGSGSGTDLEFRRFLRMALRSAYEVMAALEIAANLKLVKKDIIEARLQDADELCAMISGLIKKLKSTRPSLGGDS